MANNLKAYKQVTLNDEVILLKFDVNAVCDLEDYFNKGIVGILNEEQIGFKLIRSLYWAGAKWKDQSLTVEKMGRMIQKHLTDNEDADMMELMKPAMDALKASRLLGTNKKDKYDIIDAPAEEVETIESEVQDPNA
jgi:hypothetical protein